MSTNIYDIANELERAIRNLPEYKAVEVVKVSVEGNPEAKEILNSYISFQKDIQNKIQSGDIPTEADQKTMLDFNKKVQANPLLTEYFSKQQQLASYVADLERIIFQPLNELL
ncbi:TPA: YlbF/YmcA family competence regulator [Streptococcus suis]|uniref:YlbF/YmcA family competence regulator n=1 Tax=Streptococcus suis TaxID=1307 RepID=UPI002117ACAF|nr:YlbF/YmcA family competence regulator [Streptococcus suis]HEL2111410.1 YlbF/YmcA family competence regulator [Streptococcus suis]HEL9630684.1 YlbF/YmcA family competence regulator [Streptococcus suis]